MARAWAALSRGDDEIIYRLVFDRDIEFNIIGGGVGGPPPGLGERYDGHDGWREFIGQWRAEWGGGHIEHTPEALIDLGDRLVMRVTLAARGAASGAGVAMTMGIVSWLADGVVVRQDNYYQWSECVKARGLAEVATAVSA